MSGAAIPYHLRPHKAVDRRLFLDLLSRYERWKSLAEYIYISMGAYPLEDHKLVHRIVGIRKLVAFDLNDEVVSRQRFNKPIDSCYCIRKKSGELISDLDAILSGLGFSSESGIVIWLDYTEPAKIGEQIREFEALLNKLRAGDVVRVTVNAHPSSMLEQQRDAEGRPLLAVDKRAKQFERLQERIGDSLPSWAAPEHMTSEYLPLVISEAFAAAALRALPISGATTFAPLSIIRYADGQQMLSITGTLVDRTEENALLARLDLHGWPFASSDWKKIHQLVVPHLTLRERLFLERGVVGKSAEELMADLGFETAADVKIKDFLENYKNYYRFYPTLLTSEL